MMTEPMDMNQSSNLLTSSHLTSAGRIKKKPGRKPNPASPALRKAQNRAAQKAFRERKEQKMKELEVDTKQLLQERDYYYKKSQQLSKENNTLKCENWYLKGIVLSLQLVCFKTKLRIPRHTPHIDEQVRQVMASTIPESIASHINGMSRDSSSRNNNSNKNSNNSSSNNIDDDTLSKTDDGRLSVSLSPSSSSRSEFTTPTPPPPSQKQPMMDDTIEDDETDVTQPVMLSTDSSTNNMAAIQSLRLRLRIQSALFRENAAPPATKPSPLQLSVPHDPRIDLIPTVHMRDRMILFRDQFDLEDVMRLLVNEAVFHGGNPSEASNWELPEAFFEKYWYLTTDYTLERTSQRWRQLKSIMANEAMMTPTTHPDSPSHPPHPHPPPQERENEQSWSDTYPTSNDLLAMMQQPTSFNPGPQATENYSEYGLPYRFGQTSVGLLPQQDPFHAPPPPPPPPPVQQQQSATPWQSSYPFM